MGRMEGAVHRYPVRVYYEDTDAGGIVYHANYLRFCERARNEMMRLVGYSHSGMVRDTGVAFAVRRCEIEFLRPARLDDALEVVTRINDIGGATLDAIQVVRLVGGADGVPVGTDAGAVPEAGDLVRVTLRLACINQNGRPVRLPLPLRTALAGLCASRGQD